jgi:kynurenine formamidase
MKGFRLVDLSVRIADDLPAVWPGNPELRFETFHWFDDPQPYFNRCLTIDEHVGTHWDAPAHFLADHVERGLSSTDDVPLDRLVVPAAVLDATDLTGSGDAGVSPRVSAERILAWERANGELRPGDGVLLRSDWSDRYYKPFPAGHQFADDVIAGSAPAWPALDDEACLLLLERGVVLAGFDTPSAGAWDDVTRVHRLLLGRNVVVVENLIGLGALPIRGSTFLFLPLKLAGGSGAPGRAVALVPEELT